MKTENLTIEAALKASNDGQNQDIKSKFVGQHVFCNVNTMVEHILKNSYEVNDSPFNYEDVENLYSFPEYIGTHTDFQGGSEEDREEEIDRLKEMLEDDEILPISKDEIQEDIESLEGLESEPQEVFEWWAVSSFLYEKLKALGHPVLDAGSCYVWGRCTTGQAILLDYSISQICAEMEILEGQANSWARK